MICALRARGEGAKTSRKGRFYSFQTVGRGAACLKRKGVSPSAEGDLRLCLKNSRGSGGFPKENGGGSRQDRVDFCRRQICLRRAT